MNKKVDYRHYKNKTLNNQILPSDLATGWYPLSTEAKRTAHKYRINLYLSSKDLRGAGK